MIPEHIQLALEELLAPISQEKLTAAYAELNSFYRERKADALPPLQSFEKKCAYLSARFPATFAAVSEVLTRTRAFYKAPIKSLLDLGAGPGTAYLAAKEVFNELSDSDLVERDADLIRIGKKLDTFQKAKWQQQDIKNLQMNKSYDLIIASYAFGELRREEQVNLINQLWPYGELITIIEPGTPHGFATIRAMRAQLIELGGFPVAPCPHSLACPMAEDDWCHFSVRLERSKSHRLSKQATLSYEDEKFSYVSIAKKPVPLPSARILRHPMKHTGHVNFSLCTPMGIQKRTVSKKDKEFYKEARKLEWGDPFFDQKQ